MTKIELLIVLLIIGVLGSISAVAVSLARERTRDATRLAHVREVQDALESYFSDTGMYPVAPDSIALGASTTLCLAADGFDCSIAPDGAYLEIVPSPPTKGLKEQVKCAGVENGYCYTSDDGTTYTLDFELEKGNRILGLTKGANCATPEDLAPGACTITTEE